jgi:drug/metabolite transporter (DMT)-like permease
VLAVLCALLAALMYALASVLQQRGAARQPIETSMRLGLLTRLARNGPWVLGLVCDVAGYALQFVALGHGPLVVVQPLLVCGLLFALPLGAAWAGRALHPRDWVAALAVCAGLAVFLTVSSPAKGTAEVSGGVWAALVLGTAALAAVLIVSGSGRATWNRAMLLSAAAGVIYGASAALTAASARLLGKGVVVLLEHWQPYVLVVGGVVGMLVSQSAFQAGSLDVSLPMMTVVDPVVSIVIGATAFAESISDTPAAVAAEAASLLLMTAGVVVLARSEAIRGLRGEGVRHQEPA